jgi:glutathione S-transferase
MSFKYLEFNDAKKQKGLRLTVVRGIPSPWSEAAKAIFHVKSIPFSAVYFDPFNKEMASWIGSPNAPVAVYDNEDPVSDWKDILALAERLAPSPTLVPSQKQEHDAIMEISNQICSPQGLGWYRRLEGVHKGLNAQPGGFPDMVAKYLAKKYGYQAESGPEYASRTIDILSTLSQHLKQQQSKGSRYFVGNSLSAADIYSATAMACFKPLPQEQCAMLEFIRPVFETLEPAMEAALDPILIEHRDRIYKEYLTLPLSL